MFLRRRRKTLCLYCLSVVGFALLWTLLTVMLLAAQENFIEVDTPSLQLLQPRPTDDSYMGRGIQVVVGHYNGKLPDQKKPNFTREELDGNRYAPKDDMGEMGRAVKLSNEDEELNNELFGINQFSLVASDRIALNRSLPDVRKKACQLKSYPTDLPDTSVIIVYHNEAWSTLLRTVTSVINRSPAGTLREVILVDDFSDREFLNEPLDRYVATFDTPVKIIRASSRVGLIRARLMGAKEAAGDVLTFLDSHCECTEGWLEPLLARIKEDRKAVVCPVIDVINDRTFSYQKGIELFRGGFNWNLQFRWYSVPPHLVKARKLDGTMPIKSPTMAGGLFSIDRRYFEELGTYDAQMDIWGGENLEISFRVWQCGGQVEILPCSHVGHVFRKASPHDFPDNGSSRILNSNLVRVAEVWMDHYKHMFYRTAPQAVTLAKDIDVSDRLELKKHLRCKDFDWYLNEVWPEHFLPKAGQFFGRVKNVGLDVCLRVAHVLTSMSNTGRRKEASLDECVVEKFYQFQVEQMTSRQCIASTPGEPGKRTHTLGLNKCTLGFDMWQLWIYTDKGQLKGDEHQCLSATQIAQQWFLQLKECGEYENEFWDYNKYRQTLTHRQSGYCLDQPIQKSGKDETKTPSLQRCARGGKTSQQWTFHPVDWLPSKDSNAL